MENSITKEEYVAAFQNIYAHLYRTVLYILKDRHLAYDIVQETFIRGCKKIDTLNNPDSFKPWINRIAINITYDYLRRTKETSIEDINKVIQLESISSGIPDSSVENKILNHELSSKIKDAICSLDESHSLILVLRFYCELSYNEIASELGIDLNAVRSRLYRAKNLLRRELANSDIAREYFEGVKANEK
ncbi:MAG: hypothetical protein HPY66_0353 [Firmicutes bacterium]|nr:hypothetical protein [Bacillota bacterium]